MRKTDWKYVGCVLKKKTVCFSFCLKMDVNRFWINLQGDFHTHFCCSFRMWDVYWLIKYILEKFLKHDIINAIIFFYSYMLSFRNITIEKFKLSLTLITITLWWKENHLQKSMCKTCSVKIVQKRSKRKIWHVSSCWVHTRKNISINISSFSLPLTRNFFY